MLRRPYKFIDRFVRYTSERVAKLRETYTKLSDTNEVLTPYAKKMLTSAFEAQRKRSYQMEQQAGSNTWMVWDPQSRHQVRHSVCIDPEKISCTPCATWGVHRACCAHMLLVLARVKPHLVRNMAALARATFHPAYLVKNGVKGCSDKTLVPPVINEGPISPPLPIALDSDGEEVEEDPTPDSSLPTDRVEFSRPTGLTYGRRQT